MKKRLILTILTALLFGACSNQNEVSQNETEKPVGFVQKEEKAKKISGEMLEYLSEILNIDLTSNELLKISMENFVPSSLIRTRYGIEATNPFLGDIREMYSGIFATCFTLTRFYEKYCGAIPTDHEISFLALFVGGALHRNVKTIRAVILGTSGIAA